MSSIGQSIYERVEAERTKYPDQALSSIFKRLKVNGPTYYKYKKFKIKMSNDAPKPKRKYTRVAAPKDAIATNSNGQMLAIFGSPAQIMAFAAEVMP